MTTATAKGRRCMCGCGTLLGTYNGKPLLVCYEMWQRVPAEIRHRIMLPLFPTDDTRRAVYEVFKLAVARRNARTA